MYVFLLSPNLLCKINYLHLHHNNKTTRQWKHRSITKVE